MNLIIEKQREFFATGKTKDLSFRLTQLKNLKTAIARNETLISEALFADLKKSEAEAFITELGVFYKDLDLSIKKLHRWIKPRRVGTPVFYAIASSKTIPEPYGNCLIIGPWNYPFLLVMTPLVGALAAGNTAIIKPSEFAPHVSAVLKKIVDETFEEQLVAVVEGAVHETTELLAQKFDYIFFTGSSKVGRIVYEAAAKNLTPVTLELGGKSPCIIDTAVDIELTARRIVFGKFLNCGQTCIAPDYLLVQEGVKAELVVKLMEKIKQFYGAQVKESEDFGRIISSAHFDRLTRLLKEGNILFGGDTDPVQKYISPTIIDGVTSDHQLMKEEIFGPILPIITYSKVEEAIDFVNAGPKPLALYIFSKDKAKVKKVLGATSSGVVCVNDTVLQYGNYYLPFGGVGDSGMGTYHGRHSFEMFSHHKSVLYKSFFPDINIRYAPWKKNLSLFKKLFKYLG